MLTPPLLLVLLPSQPQTRTGASNYAHIFGHSYDITDASCYYEYYACDDNNDVSSPVLKIDVAVSVRDVDEDRARKYVHHLRFDQFQAAPASSLKDRKSEWARGARLPQELPQEVGSHGSTIFKERESESQHCSDGFLQSWATWTKSPSI